MKGGHMTEQGQAEQAVPAVAAPEVKIRDYLLTIRLRSHGLADDMEAREQAKTILTGMGLIDTATGAVKALPEGDEIKLQEVFKSGPPRRVDL
jgi:hypothetical protein